MKANGYLPTKVNLLAYKLILVWTKLLRCGGKYHCT